MRRIALIMLLIMFVSLTSSAMAHDVQVTWSPNDEPDLDGYRVWWGTEPDTYPHVQDAGLATYDVIYNLDDGTYYIATTAYDIADNESDKSTFVTIDLGAPPEEFYFPDYPQDWFLWLDGGVVWDPWQNGELLTTWTATPGWQDIQSSEFAFRMANYDTRAFLLVMVFRARADGRVVLYMRDAEIVPHGSFHYEDVTEPLGLWKGDPNAVWIFRADNVGVAAQVESDRRHITFWWVMDGVATQILGINFHPTGGAVDIADIWSVVYQ